MSYDEQGSYIDANFHYLLTTLHNNTIFIDLFS